MRNRCRGTKPDLQLCCCCVAPSTVSRGDSATFDWWAELWMATPGTCCHDDGIKICWVPVGQACWKIQTLHFRTSRAKYCRIVSNNQCQNGRGKKSHAETKRETNWLIDSTGNSTKPDKRATSPKPFLYFSIALQQMHKVTSCKAQTNEALNSPIRYYVHKQLCLLKKKHWGKEICLVHWCQTVCW